MVKVVLYIIIFISFLFCYNKSIDVVTTNDLHGVIDAQKANFINPSFPPTIIGGSGFIQYVNDLREELDDSPILLLDGGNFFQGHPAGIIDSGRTIINWMNKVGYHAMVPGNNDFLFGIDNLVNLSKEAEFSFLAANLYYENTNSLIFKPYEIIDFGNIKVGVIGLVNPNLKNLVLHHNLNNVLLKNPIETLDNIISNVKSQADIIILLTSAGVPWDRDDVYNKFINKIKSDIIKVDELNAIELGYYLSGVDIVVSGGISKGYPTPWYDPNSHVFTFQNYGGGTSFGHFILQYDHKEKLFTGYESAVTGQVTQTLFINDFSFDEEVYDWIKNISTIAENKVYKKINWESSVQPDGPDLIIEDSKDIDNWDIPNLNIENNLDIITWNCEFFPIAKDSTIRALSEAVYDLNPDIIAFQEIKNRGWFGMLMELLPDFNYIISQQSSFMDQAIIYKAEDFTLVNRLELFAENDYNFAGRPPLKADFIHNKTNLKFSVINLHMKCCDSGLQRRIKAAEMLYDYINNEIDVNSNLIILGDWNDDLKDEPGEHCFDSFLSDNRFYFPTMDLIYDITKASYPKEPYISFLDHILVTNSFVKKSDYIVDTVPMDEYMGSFNIYEDYISDHMPVYLSFPY